MVVYKLEYGEFVYIGRTSNFKKRMREHKCQFNTNKSPFNGVCPDFSLIHSEILQHCRRLNHGAVEMSEIQLQKAIDKKVLNKNDGDFSAQKLRSNHGLKTVKLKQRMEEEGSRLQALSTQARIDKFPLISVYSKSGELVISSRSCLEISKKIGVNATSVTRYRSGERKSRKFNIVVGGGLSQ